MYASSTLLNSYSFFLLHMCVYSLFLFCFFVFQSLYLFICGVHVHVRVRVGVRRQLTGVGSVLQPSKSLGQNLGCQVWQKAKLYPLILLAPSFLSLSAFFCLFSFSWI